MSHPTPTPHGFPQAIAPRAWWQRWWSSQSSHRQDRFAMLAPLAAVLLFLAAIVAAFWYLRLEEVDREQEAVKRDLEYAQQRLRLRLLERQEQLMRLARDISNKEMDPEEFMARAEALVVPVPRAAGHHLDRRASPDHRQPGHAQPRRRQSVGGR
jgi:hypothetical protein